MKLGIISGIWHYQISFNIKCKDKSVNELYLVFCFEYNMSYVRCVFLQSIGVSKGITSAVGIDQVRPIDQVNYDELPVTLVYSLSYDSEVN